MDAPSGPPLTPRGHPPRTRTDSAATAAGVGLVGAAGVVISFSYFRAWALWELRAQPFFWPKWCLGFAQDALACGLALVLLAALGRVSAGRSLAPKGLALVLVLSNWANFELTRHIGQPFLPQALGVLSLGDALSGYGIELVLGVIDPWHCLGALVVPGTLVALSSRRPAHASARALALAAGSLVLGFLTFATCITSAHRAVREFPRTLTWNFYGHGARHWLAYLRPGAEGRIGEAYSVEKLSSVERSELVDAARRYFGEDPRLRPYPEHPLFRDAGLGRVCAPARRKNVLMIHLESFRAASFDGLGDVWTGITPRLAERMKRGAYFTRAFTNNIPSDRSVTSMLCSVPVTDQAISALYRPRPSVRCLPRLLREAGYRNARMSGIPSGFQKLGEFFAEYGVEETFGSRELDEGFPHEALPRLPESGYDEDKLYDERLFYAARSWLEQHGRAEPSRPFFLLLETMTNHVPWELPSSSARSMAPYEALSVGPELTGTQETARLHRTMRLSDDYVADFLDWLDALDGGRVAKETIVVLYSDHPPWFAEPSFLRYDQLIRESWIPLFILGLEEAKRGAYSHPVSLLDVAPTLLELVGAPGGHAFAGKDLFDDSGPHWFTFSRPGEGRVFFASGESLTFSNGRRARLREDMTLEPLAAGPSDDERHWALLERHLLRGVAVERSLVPFGYARRIEPTAFVRGCTGYANDGGIAAPARP